MDDRILQIGIFGTFDVKNFGDLLFPLIAESELCQRLGAVKIHPFSYHAKTPPDWPYTVTSLIDLPSAVRDLDGILIGGGHIIRFDKNVAVNYGPPTQDIHYPTGYWLAPILVGLQNQIPIAWNCPGFFGEIPAWAVPLLKVAIEYSDYIAVRDLWAQETLTQFVPDLAAKITLKPDTGFGISQLLPPDKISPEFLNLRSSFGLTRPYIIVQPTINLDSFTRLVRDNLQFFANYHLLVLPIGPACGDKIAIIENELPDFIGVSEWPTPLLLAELIREATAVVGTSFHLTITAINYGVPVFRPMLSNNRKYSILSKFETVYEFENLQLISMEWFVTCLKRCTPSKMVNLMHEELSSHWDQIAALFKAGTSKHNALPALAKLWQLLPTMLESYS